MNIDIIKSDQLIKWSDNAEKESFLFTTEKERVSSTAIQVRNRHYSWFSNRALQTLWKAGMQMCQNSWPWAEVLFINQLSQTKARDGLCTIGLQEAGRKVFKEFSYCTRYPGRNLYDKPGTSPAKREVLNKGYGSSCRIRCLDSWNFNCQHDRRLSERKYQNTGGWL